jgi:hypothetical protein
MRHVDLTFDNGLRVLSADASGHGGAHHQYEVVMPDGLILPINFQNGPVSEEGTNGLTEEILLAIVVNRLQSFQAGTYACRENALALTKLEEALHWLDHRTRARAKRGVEGTSKL